MIETVFNSKICAWNIDSESLDQFKKTSIFHRELYKAYEDKNLIHDVKEKDGNAFSLKIGVLERFFSFSEIEQFLAPSIEQHLDLMGVKKDNRSLRLIRCWANRMYKDSSGLIHDHLMNRMVLIFYYDVPEKSGDLILIDRKHKDKVLMSEKCIPENDKKSIKVTTGMCILHESELLHAVSVHKADSPRECLIFEFESLLK